MPNSDSIDTIDLHDDPYEFEPGSRVYYSMAISWEMLRALLVATMVAGVLGWLNIITWVILWRTGICSA